VSKWKSAVTGALLVVAPLFAETDVDRTNRELARIFGTRKAETRSSATASPYVSSLVAAMNRERAGRGLQPLKINTTLSLAAGDRISDMFAKRYFDHVAPDGTEPFTWVRKRGYRYRMVGENLALGYRNSNAVVDGWMHSPGHRANILKSGFNEIGLAVANGSPTRGYAGPTVVALYASR
jgi:uncharacterized protein YkwD